MKNIKKIIGWGLGVVFLSTIPQGCTNLDETVYDQVMSANYYNTKMDVIRAVFRPYEHCFESIIGRFEREEEPADQLITPTRDTWWTDNQKWEHYHYHEWDIDGGEWTGEWNSMYAGIGQANLVLGDLDELNPGDYDLTHEEFNAFKGQLRCIRAYCYLRLFNAYRHLVLTTSASETENAKPENRKQVEPIVMWNFLEGELKECISLLPAKSGQSGNGPMQGQFTKGAAAGLLVRLYLNSEKWIGEAKYTECIELCKRITSGEFGHYAIADRWDEAFDWNNETSNEVLFAFPSSYGGTHWHYRTDHRTIYWRCNPYTAEKYFNIEKAGQTNPKYAISPSFDVDGSKYNYKLGMVTQKFQKYPGDVRYKQYKNLGNNTREGMFFLEGYVRSATNGANGKCPSGAYTMYLRDQVGQFREGALTGTIAGPNKESKLANGDFNSGFYCVKYPFYTLAESGSMESDFCELRLTEIIYSQAECELRLGDARAAGTLLNSVRKRNYPSTYWQQNLYEPEGRVKLDMEEMLDEWGREFLAESRRRTDLIRFGRFGETWWDKEADADNHWELYPISRTALNQNKYLKQNPGYEDIAR